MIRIEHYPRLGTHGWRAVITVYGTTRDVLRIGTRADIETAAQATERGMVWMHLQSQRAAAARSIA